MSNVGDNPGAWGIDGHAAQIAALGIAGAVTCLTLSAAPSAGSGDGTNEYITNATGWKRVLLIPLNLALEKGKALLVGFSGTESDQAALTAQLDALRTDCGAADAATPTVNVFPHVVDAIPIELTWDGESRIKTVSVASQATNTYIVAAVAIG